MIVCAENPKKSTHTHTQTTACLWVCFSKCILLSDVLILFKTYFYSCSLSDIPKLLAHLLGKQKHVELLRDPFPVPRI